MFLNFFKKKKKDSEKEGLDKKAFTLIEIIVVVFIILTLSVIVVFNYEWGGYQITLSQSANKLAQDVRKAQGMAQAYSEVSGEVPEGGYGLYFNLSENYHYIIFGDRDGDGMYHPSRDLVIEDVALQEGIEISSYDIAPGGMEGSGFGGAPLNIVFEPPDPIVSITPDAQTANITLRSARTNDTTRIYINVLGVVQVDEPFEEEGSFE